MPTIFPKIKHYSLRKSKTILRHNYHLYLKRKPKLSELCQNQMETALAALQKEILSKEKVAASEMAHQVEQLAILHLKKHPLARFFDVLFALAFALAVAILIRQVWFEFYEIPTGSMRPTFMEKDRVAVSKTTFGINVPLKPKHFLFDPSLVKRGNTIIFTGANMDIHDLDMRYFYLFPGKKQFVKRLLGKPGDSLYFYGGKLYGVDKEGNDITSELNPIEAISHVPMIQFEGKTSTSLSPKNNVFTPVISYQMNEPVAKLTVGLNNFIRGEMLPLSGKRPAVPDYYYLWGMNDYAQVRLLNKTQAEMLTTIDTASLPPATLYLELEHHPTVKNAILLRDDRGRLRPTIGTSTSLLPLQESHLRALMDNLYTARFWVREGFASRYGMSSSPDASPYRPRLEGVPDGCYEFYYGKAYKIGWQGIAMLLPPDHPLYTFTPERVQILFNLGIEFDERFSPTRYNTFLYPSRFSFYRDGSLYLLNAPIFTPDDPLLIDFIARENQTPMPYIDPGPPLLPDGTIDREKIQQQGVLVPEEHYFVLGDNYAMSGDSREFGFVPAGNLRGSPSLIFWPPGKRFGAPNQPGYALFPLPRLIIWTLAGICFSFWWVHHRKKNHLPFPLEKKDSSED